MERIPLFKAKICMEAADEVTKVIGSGWPGMGPKVRQFEEKLEGYFGGGVHAVALNSGTAALHVACYIAQKRSKVSKYVLTTPLTFVSTTHAIKYVGLEPIFVDVDPETGCMSYASFSRAIDKYKDDIAALMLVHYGGQPADLFDFSHYLDRANISADVPIIQDCAHAMGAGYYGDKIGVGEMCCFSFHAVKNLPMGDGGAFVTTDVRFAEWARKLRWLGIDKSTFDRSKEGGYSWKYDCPEVGFKCHMDDIHAAIGIAQLDHLEKENQRRKEIANMYTAEIIRLLPDCQPLIQRHMRNNAYHLFVVRFNNEKKRDEVQEHLRSKGIGTGVHYLPSYLFKPYENCIRIDNCKNTEEFYRTCLSLPMHMYLTDDDTVEVVKTIEEVL